MRNRFAGWCLVSGILCGPVGLAGQAPSASNGKIETIATLPSAAPTENLCQAPDGSIYITGIDDKVVWKVAPDGRVDKFATVPSVAAVVGIATAGDGFVIATFGKPFRRPAPAAAQPPGGAAPAQVIDFSDVGTAVLVLDRSGTVTATIPGQKGNAFNGIAPAGGGSYLIADSNASTVWRFDLGAKRLEPWIQDEVLAPTAQVPIGANGIKVHDGWVYVTVTSRNAIYRVQMGADGRPTGPLVKFAEGFRPDDFDVAQDGSLYASSGMIMYKVSSTGEVSKFLENVPGGAATLVSRDGKWLYWPTRGGTAPQRLLRTTIQ